MDTWNTLVEWFSHVTDALGKPIDPEIFELVVAMNALGFQTIQSCGGHLEQRRGLLLPWVDFQAVDPSLASLQAENRQLMAGVQQAHQTLSLYQSQQVKGGQIAQAKRTLDELAVRMQKVQREIRLLQLEPRKKLAEYLSQFYTDRSVPFDRRLILEGKDATRLHNQGAVDLYFSAPLEIQRQKLVEYREEFSEFTAFLKQCYFLQKTIYA
ncbi:MAG TPA: hypothetical protein VFV38_40915 [Ktedonobacteraceae bacterium]|nr:hypothetical protein [Ktedonobacteraceae bacterium]